MTPDTTIVVRQPADLVDAAPYVIGFHPTQSLVVLGLSGGRVFFGARYDLPSPDSDDIMRLGAIVAAQRARCVALLAYGPPAAADPVIHQALDVLEAFRVRVLEAVRVHDGRWWSYFCQEPTCCPPDGVPFDPTGSLIAAQATYGGKVALPSRQALVAQVAPVEGEAREAMVRATARARAAHDRLLVDDQRGERAVRRAGRLAVRDAEKRYRAGRRLTDDEVAWLGVLLTDPDVHEYTLGRVGDEEWRLSLWTNVLRRVEPGCVPAVGCVLGYLAWRAGQGALARVAVDRALHADPLHRMSGLLDEVLGLGIGPHAIAALDSPPRPLTLDRNRPVGDAAGTSGRGGAAGTSRGGAAGASGRGDAGAASRRDAAGASGRADAAGASRRDAEGPSGPSYTAGPGGADDAMDGGEPGRGRMGSSATGGSSTSEGPASPGHGRAPSSSSRETKAPPAGESVASHGQGGAAGGQGGSASGQSGSAGPGSSRPPRRKRRLRGVLRRQAE
jgi:hypothetical protein